MASLLQSQQIHTLTMAISIFFMCYLLPLACSLSFNFTTFDPNNIADISFERDAFPSQNVLQLTKNAKNDNLTSSVG